MSSQNVNLALDDIIKQRKSKSKLRVVKNSGGNNFRRNNSNYGNRNFNKNRPRRFNNQGGSLGRGAGNNNNSFADRRHARRGGNRPFRYRNRRNSLDRGDRGNRGRRRIRFNNRGDRGDRGDNLQVG